MKLVRCQEGETKVSLTLFLFKQLWIFLTCGIFPYCCSEHLNFVEGDVCVTLSPAASSSQQTLSPFLTGLSLLECFIIVIVSGMVWLFFFFC